MALGILTLVAVFGSQAMKKMAAFLALIAAASSFVDLLCGPPFFCAV
jgi:hypothetical protein